MRNTTLFHIAAWTSAIGATLTFIAGCAPDREVEQLPYDTKLGAIFDKNLGDRARAVDVSSMSLRCGTNKKLKTELVRYDSLSSNHTVTSTLDTDTPCSEEGLLVHVTSDGSYGYTTRAKHSYEQELVLREWQRALVAAVGTSYYNDAISAGVRDSYGPKFTSMSTYGVDFYCDEAAHTVRYSAVSRGDRREGSLKVACPAGSERGHPVVRIVQSPHSYYAREDVMDYRVVTTKAATPEFVAQVVEGFLVAIGPRDKF